jgi:1-deoxy-D-xylulose-5-phosphate synthase
VALQNLDVTFALDRAGLVGADGATHAGNYDLAYLRCIPNMVVMAASDEAECRAMLSTGFLHDGPAAIRYPRGAAAASHAASGSTATLAPLPIGKGVLLREGAQRAPAVGLRVAILAFGSMVPMALAAGEALDATVANMRFVKPIDATLLAELAQHHDLLVTVEEGTIMGGAGSACAEALTGTALVRPFLHLGLPDLFVDHGDPVQLLAQYGLSEEGIVSSIRSRLAQLASRRDSAAPGELREPRLVVSNG